MGKATHNQFVNWYQRYLNSNDKELSDVYGKYSSKKESEYRKIITRYLENYTNYNLHILGHSPDFFTTGAICETETEDYFVVETYANTYTCGYSNGNLYDLKTGEIFYEQ